MPAIGRLWPSDDDDDFDGDDNLDGDGFGDDEVSVISPRSLEILLCENLIVANCLVKSHGTVSKEHRPVHYDG